MIFSTGEHRVIAKSKVRTGFAGGIADQGLWGGNGAA